MICYNIIVKLIIRQASLKIKGLVFYMKASNILPAEFHSFYKPYMDKLGDMVLIEGLKTNLKESLEFFDKIPVEKHGYCYQEDKWTIKDVIQHMIDVERVFAYRALRFSRGDQTNLPGFDENDYAKTAEAINRSWESLISEFEMVRKSNILLFESFSDEKLTLAGTANNGIMTVRALGFVIIGHCQHHLRVLEERYLQDYSSSSSL